MKRRDQSEEDKARRGITRRQFLTTMGVGTAAVAVSGKRAAHGAEEEVVVKAGEMTRVALNINGRRHRLMVEPRWSLLFVLRERLGLAGTKVGCERGECGACTVLINDVPKYACMTLAIEAEGARITTVEGLMKGEELGPVQQAFLEEDAFQCGYCTPGQIMAVEGLCARTPTHLPTRSVQQ
jgi:xanthine dehydrogenase YagT iron-sulfur-binding subunit